MFSQATNITLICLTLSQTNDSKVVGAVKMDHFLLVAGPAVTHSNSQLLHSWMKSRFHGNLTAVEVKGEDNIF